MGGRPGIPMVPTKPRAVSSRANNTEDDGTLRDPLGRLRFAARWQAKCFSSRNCGFLDHIFKHQFSDLVLDGDRGRSLRRLPNRFVCIASSWGVWMFSFSSCSEG
jgi:hypothetical protein